MCVYFTVVMAILTILIGMITSYIAYAQMNIARAKVKLDLYERRFNVYVVALNCYQELYKQQPQQIAKRTYDVIQSCRESKFLFKEEDGIDKILDKMKENSDQVCKYEDYVSKNGRIHSDDPQTAQELLKKATDAKKDFEAKLYDLEVKIKPYIQFQNVKGC
ncbi:hypothetical protein HK18_10575 [Commensalibacter intestini]|uniref:Uncharacterized protein n=1 Tax=Commensalibacter intestini TaxID=479936 RepID=A0A251ZUW3_9PROT|nr:hypothetical protein [Commensalibacter intestini]OUI78455.1 hypothetical protein HK18_10575 [Commensalibacter intestini]